MEKEQVRQTVLAVCGLAALLFSKQPRVIAAVGVVQLLALNHWDEVWAIYKQDPSPHKPLLMQQWVAVTP